MTSFATELATTTVTDVRTDTLPHLIYKDNNDNICIDGGSHITESMVSHFGISLWNSHQWSVE